MNAKKSAPNTAPTAASAANHGAADDGAAETGARRRFKEVWLVEDRREGKAFWTRVGTAFENRDGSWNVRLSAVPVGNGNLNIRDPRPAEQVAA